MMLATTTVADFDRWVKIFSTVSAEKRRQHGSKGAHIYRDPNQPDRVWVIFDWDEKGWQSFVMPALTMGIILTATNVRLVRTSMLETLGQQYVTVARAKGLSERVVLYKHALRNCAIPLVTYLGLQFGGLLGGIVVVERVFNWPGLGTLAFDAVAARDYPVLQGVIVVLSLMIVLVNLLVDIAYGLIDPRIRTE